MPMSKAGNGVSSSLAAADTVFKRKHNIAYIPDDFEACRDCAMFREEQHRFEEEEFSSSPALQEQERLKHLATAQKSSKNLGFKTCAQCSKLFSKAESKKDSCVFHPGKTRALFRYLERV